MPLAAAGPIRGVSARTSSPQFKVGSFTVTTLGSSDRTSVTGVGFRPTSVMVWGVAYSTTEGAWQNNVRHVLGLGSEEYDIHSGLKSDNGAAAAVSTVIGGQGLLSVYGTSTVTGTFASMDGDGFTIAWSGTTTVASFRLYYVAFGGFGTRTRVTNTTFPSSLADVVVTNGAFRPSAMLHTFAHDTFSHGAATGASNQWAVGAYSANAADPTDTVRYADDDAILIGGNNLGVRHESAFSSFNDGGFTLTQTENSGLAGGGTLLLGDLTGAKAATFAKATATGSQAITGLGFRPSVVLFFTTGSAVSDTLVAGAMLSIGAATSASEQVCAMFADEDNQATTDARAYQSSAACILIGDVPGTIRGQAALTSLDADGFTLNWSTNDATVNSINYLALA